MNTAATSRPAARSNRSAFGLVELMTSVAVLGILAAIALTMFTKVAGKADERRIAHIAQQYAHIANSALAAGSDEFISATSVQEVMQILSTGVRGTGVFADTEFSLAGYDADEQERAAEYLIFTDGSLVIQ